MRSRFVQSIGGTLSFTPPEVASLGVPTSATVSITASDGTELPVTVGAAVATVSTQGALSYALGGAQCPDPVTNGRHLYRAAWRYIIAGVTYETDQLYEVRRRVLKSTLSYAEVESDLPADVYSLCEGGPVAVQTAMGNAWDDVLDDLAGRGMEPDRVMDSDRLRRPHRIRTLVRLALGWGPAWRQYATDREEQYQSALEKVIGSPGWYDQGAADAVESKPTDAFVPSIVLTR